MIGISNNNNTNPQVDMLADQMKVAVSTLVEVSSTLSKNIIETQTKILNDYTERLANLSNNNNNNNNAKGDMAKSEQQAVDPTQALTNELQGLIKQGKYGDAFSKVAEESISMILLYNYN